MTLDELISIATEHLHRKKYAQSTITHINHTWNQLKLFSKIENVDYYTFELGLKFAKIHYKVNFLKLEKPMHSRESTIYRAIKTLDEVQRGVELSCYKRPLTQPLPDAYKEQIEIYLSNYAKREIKTISLKRAVFPLRKFTEFLCSRNIFTLNNVMAIDITDYASTLNDYVSTTRNTHLSRIRDFLLFSFKTNQSKENLSIFVAKSRYKPADILPSVYSQDEISQILAAVDRANPIGKRDFAILVLASNLGMRSGDIANLQYEHFDWQKNEIKFMMQKGGQQQVLPLLKQVGECIVDYLKHGRPEIDSNFIFLKHSAPYSPLSAAALHPIMKKYRQIAKIPNSPQRKAGLHALRHSLATNLLENNTPLPIISEILGHQKTDTTRIYTKVDISSLRTCALEVPFVPE